MKKRILHLAALTLMAGALSFVTPVWSYAALETEAAEESEEFEEADDDGGFNDDLISGEIKSQGPAAVHEALEAAKAAAELRVHADDVKRQDLVDYAMQFVGGKYRAGGNDPNTGADCSGFVKYVMQNGAGVPMNRSAATQISQGVSVNADQMQPGDLVFYSNGSRINHVAMYIGDGQIVHASTYSTGIKVSPWNYRAPAKIMNVLD